MQYRPGRLVLSAFALIMVFAIAPVLDLPAFSSASAQSSRTATPTRTRTPTSTATWTSTATATSSGSFQPIRVNAGGVAYTDGLGRLWASDSGSSGGSTAETGSPIAGTSDDPLYQSERYGDFGYQFPVPNGPYTVTLKFAEFYWNSAGQRVFDVLLEGQPVLSNFDILAQVAPNTALDRIFTANVSDGSLTIEFRTRVDNAKLSALEILPGTAVPSLTPSPTPTVSVPNPAPGSLQAMVNAAAPGSVVSVPPGIYREQVTINKRLTLAAQPGAEIRGSDVWTGWSQQGGRWVSQRTVPGFPAISTDRCDGGRCAWREQVFLDGVPLTQVATGTLPAAEQFALDGTRHVVLADNPTGRLVEVTTRTAWIIGQASDVTIQGFTMQHAASDAFSPAALDVGVNNGRWTVQDNRLLHAHGSVIFGGHLCSTGSRYLRNEIAYGGIFGILDVGCNALVQDNDIHHNAIEEFVCGWGCGGVKATDDGITFDRNHVHHNNGPALWLDVGGDNGRFTNNRVHHNVGMGIFFEISSGALITDNLVYNNGRHDEGWGWGAGIQVAASRDVEVARNIVAWNADGIAVSTQDRGDVAPAGQPANIFVHDNIIVQQDFGADAYALGWMEGWGSPMCSSTGNNWGQNNAFWSPSGQGSLHFDWCGGMSWASFVASPGGQGSRYLSAAEKDQALSSKGIPTTP